MDPAPAATALTDQQLTALRAEAAAAVTGFIDPAALRRVDSFVSGRAGWARAVTGRESFTLHSMTERELVLLDLASRAEPAPPRPASRPVEPSPAERARTARLRAAARAWAELRAALPMPVLVAYNYSGPNHFESYTQGAVHILTQAPINTGRLRRAGGQALCETPSRAAHLHFASRDRQDPADHVPTCKACLRIATRLAAAAPATPSPQEHPRPSAPSAHAPPSPPRHGDTDGQDHPTATRPHRPGRSRGR